ncbi:MAG: hypothetical protein Q9179_001070, partial [Wetmoreana sp. 5 TL-2023]
MDNPTAHHIHHAVTSVLSTETSSNPFLTFTIGIIIGITISNHPIINFLAAYLSSSFFLLTTGIMFVVALSLSVFTFTLLYERRSRGWCKVFGINEGQIEMMKMKLATGFDEVFGMKEEDFEKIRERLEMEERKKIALEESRTSRNLKSMT